MSVAYAVWAGLGFVLMPPIGVFFSREPARAWRVACIARVVIGVIGLDPSHSGKWMKKVWQCAHG